MMNALQVSGTVTLGDQGEEMRRAADLALQ
jgi:hypothetical protein